MATKALHGFTWPEGDSKDSRRGHAGMVMLVGAVGLAVAGLFARIMVYPLRHDEQMLLPVGALLQQGDLYRDFGFNHLPNLPLLLALIFDVSGTNHYLLAGRLLIFASWMVAAFAIAAMARRAAGSTTAGVLAALLLMTNPVLLGQAGMLATNNFLPLSFAVAGTALFIVGLDRDAPRPWIVGLAGLCLGLAVGFKVNYAALVLPFVLTAFVVPARLTFNARLRCVVLPLAIGGLIGGVPILFYFLRDPDGFIAHVFRYHRGPHIAYWTANPSLDGQKIVTLFGKLKLAGGLWLGGGGILILLLACYAGWANLRAVRPSICPLWPTLLVIALVMCGIVVSFVPTPAFPQYYALPIPFLIVLVALLYGRLPPQRGARIAPWFCLAAILVILAGAPRLLVRLPQIISPQSWTGFRVHAAGTALARAVAQNSGSAGPVTTLAPLYPLEGRLPLYPELATGPMVYRVGDFIPPADQIHYRMISPTRLPRLLDSRPPAAILVGVEAHLDDPFIAYARSHRYRLLPQPITQDRYGTARLYVKAIN